MSEKVTLPVIQMAGELVDRLPPEFLTALLKQLRKEKLQYLDGQVRFNTFFPPYPSLAFDRFCETLSQRRRVPFSTYLAVTSRCPFKCAHCSYGRRRGEDMTTRQLLDVIEQLKAIGTHTVGLTGGEPMMHRELEKLVAAADPEMTTIIFTTGDGLDADRARRLADAHVGNVTIGIESSDEATHDRVRGVDGSFARGREAAQVSLATGTHTSVSTVAFREKLIGGELDRIYDMAESWGVHEFRIIPPVATGSFVGCPDAMLSREEKKSLADFHLRCNRRSGGPSLACFAYLESEEMFGCGAGYHHLFIDAAGEVCPCDLTPLSFGNVTTEPLADIWERMGTYFPLPRCGCLMSQLSTQLSGATELPLPREQSEAICPMRKPDAPLPEGYRLLFGE